MRWRTGPSSAGQQSKGERRQKAVVRHQPRIATLQQSRWHGWLAVAGVAATGLPLRRSWICSMSRQEELAQSVYASYFADPFTAAQRAAPSKAVLSLVMTLTGIASSRGCMRPLPANACMNNGPDNFANILGAMPPPR